MTASAGASRACATRWHRPAAYAAQAAITTTTAYNALHRVLSTTTAASGLTNLVSSTTYDLAGRVATQTDEAGLVTSYAYAAATGGGWKTTQTLANGGTIISENFRDGRPESRTGTATVAQLFDYGVNSGDRTQWTQAATGTTTRYRTTTTDIADRLRPHTG